MWGTLGIAILRIHDVGYILNILSHLKLNITFVTCEGNFDMGENAFLGISQRPPLMKSDRSNFFSLLYT